MILLTGEYGRVLRSSGADISLRTHWILDEFLDQGVPGEMLDFL